MSSIPHNDFMAGFKIGWQVVKGTTGGLPGISSQSSIPASSTPFLQGVKAGLKAAGINV